MVLDGLRSYVQLASGLSDVTRERARAAARSLVAQGEIGVGVVLPDTVKSQVATLTDDLLAASRANRALLVNLVRLEIDRSVGRMGLVSATELDSATRRAARLESRVADLEQQLRQARSGSRAKKATSKQSTAKKSSAKKSSAKKSSAKKSSAKKSSAKKSPAKKTAAMATTAASSDGTAPSTGTTTDEMTT